MLRRKQQLRKAELQKVRVRTCRKGRTYVRPFSQKPMAITPELGHAVWCQGLHVRRESQARSARSQHVTIGHF